LAIGELAMRPKHALPNGGEHSNDVSFRGGECAFEEHAKDVFCLLQENARLRAHIAKLSGILKQYLEQDWRLSEAEVGDDSLRNGGQNA
jgi:hypothetical protein